jgi:hypothetical protein
MAKQVTDIEKGKIADLARQGLTDKEIAEELGWTHKTATRSVARERKRLNIRKDQDSDAPPKPEHVSLDSMNRENRYEYVKATLEKSPRARVFFQSLSPDERAFFEDEYFKILRSTDSINEVEEQQLFSACIEFVLATRALNFHQREEHMYAETIAGAVDTDDPAYRPTLDDKFKKDYKVHMENYKALIKDLKMSRSQRLDKIKNDRRSLVDLVTDLSDKTEQVNAAEDIIRLNKLRDSELKNMIENGYIFGRFDE